MGSVPVRPGILNVPFVSSSTPLPTYVSSCVHDVLTVYCTQGSPPSVCPSTPNGTSRESTGRTDTPLTLLPPSSRPGEPGLDLGHPPRSLTSTEKGRDRRGGRTKTQTGRRQRTENNRTRVEGRGDGRREKGREIDGGWEREGERGQWERTIEKHIEMGRRTHRDRQRGRRVGRETVTER